MSLVPAARAQVALEGWFIALESCELYQSKNNLTNPGDLRSVARTAYDMIGRNAADGAWYQVRVPGAPVTDARWIMDRCGVHVIAASPPADPSDPPVDTDPAEGPEATELVLALSWQPAFCEQRPDKAECRQLNDGLLPTSAMQLSLHGLWPDDAVYCGVPQDIRDLDTPDSWDQLPAPELDADTAERLAIAMPGTASFLERHEWIKHGTCFFGEDGGDEYYDDTLRVMDAINRSGVAQLLASHVGETVSGDDLRAAFDTAFGAGAGDRVRIDCDTDGGRVLIQELRISLRGEITEDANVGTLILAADPVGMGCDGGIIDPAGLQ